jgi:indolepyruvate ferredoxin oxidoreductase beta subunit
MERAFNIYIAGVGGQGIGLLSEILIRACDYAGHHLKAVDTHGLAQRGGMVVSQLRIGPKVFNPLIPSRQADLVVALERHEALRAAQQALKDSGTLIYYDTVWQPLSVRLRQDLQVSTDAIRTYCHAHSIRLFRIHKPELRDARRQNVVVLAHIHRNRLIAKVSGEHYRAAMHDLMSGSMLDENMAIFQAESAPT